MLASAWSRISIEMAKLAQKDKRTLLEVEIESMVCANAHIRCPLPPHRPHPRAQPSAFPQTC